jgi:DNA (cytosine-5)-methyltransferase 1
MTITTTASFDAGSCLRLLHHFVGPVDRPRVERIVERAGERFVASLEIPRDLQHLDDARMAWDIAELRGTPIRYPKPTSTARIVDLFCGCGGFAWGMRNALLHQGIRPVVTHAFDVDEKALEVYSNNFSPQVTSQDSVAMQVDYSIRLLNGRARFAYPPEILTGAETLLAEVGRTDFVIAGPPCQGHSNLNNHTRRKDPRNLLYLTTVALAVSLRARNILIENVLDVQNDHFMVVQRAHELLESSGYQVDSIVLDGPTTGLPQTRKRFFLMASLGDAPQSLLVLRQFEVAKVRTVMDAIGDLEGQSSATIFDSAPKLSRTNMERIDWLFENNAYNLANDQRPDCHKDGHSYPSVYGRLHPDQPAGTITTGLNSPGRGRYIHPTQRRTITPHEAARIQGFPDTFLFNGETIGRNSIAKLIGDAVPPLFGMIIGLAFVLAKAPKKIKIDLSMPQSSQPSSLAHSYNASSSSSSEPS